MVELAPWLAAIAGLAAGLGAGWALAYGRVAGESRKSQIQLDEALQAARTDVVTGLPNRRAFDEQLSLQSAGSRRYGAPLALLLFDVDGLKAVNDRLGHAAGDELLRRFASILKGNVREADFVARWGGDEFVALLPHTDLEGALALAARLFERLKSEGARFTVSAGAAALLLDECADDLMTRADRALREAKAAGGGQAIPAGYRSSDKSMR